MDAPIECARLLFAHGADPNGTNALAHALDYDRIEHVRLLLDRGADPNERPNLHHAVIRGRSAEFVRLLVERGADLSLRDRAGRTAYAHAVRRGHVELASALEQLGSPTDLDAGDAAVGAIVRGERPAQAPDLDADGRDAVVDGAMSGALETVVELYGTELRGNLGGTLLHNAAWLGRPEVAQRLLELGADVDARADTEWATPLGWAAFGSRHAPEAAGPADHLAVAELLLAAGAQVERKDAEMATGALARRLELAVAG
jgi:ankyrin repeat protein